MATLTVTNANDSGIGSLRAAIATASSGDTIKFSSQLANTTVRLNQQLVVDKSLTIDGSDAPNLTLSGENKTRILQVSYDYSDVVLRNLTFANGRAVDNDPNKAQQGGAIEVRDSNTLLVENSRFVNNVGERGGAIFVSYGSSATVKDSVFDGNDGSVASDDFSAGAISTYGGGEGATVVNSNGTRNVGGNSSLSISGSTFTNNKGTYGAVYTLLTNLKVEDSVFRNNEGTNGSGAIFTDGANGTEKPDDLGGTTVIRNVVADSNIGGGDYGGAFYLYGYSNDKYIIENSTITNNRARRGAGIGVQSGRDENGKGVELVIRNSTIANNIGTSQGGGLWTDVKGGVTIEDSTFSDNRIQNPSGFGIGGAVVLNTGENVKSTITDTTFTNNSAGDQAGSIWISGKTQAKNLTISDSQFAGNRSNNKGLENTVNFEVTDGGGNIVQNTEGADNGIPGATFINDLLISPPLSPTPTPEPTLDPVVPAPTPEPTPVPDPVTIPAPNPDPVSGPELPPDPNPITPASPPDIPGATPGIINLGLGLIRTSAKSVNELLVVATDDADGRINGIAPDEAGYSQALLDQAVVVFSTLKTSDSLSDLATSRSLRLPSDSNLQFAIIENGSLDGLRQGSSGKLQLVYEASGDRRPIAASTLQVEDLEFSLEADASKSAQKGGTGVVLRSLNASAMLGSNLQGYDSNSELLDFRGETGAKTATFEVFRSASFDSLVGFYAVNNEQGEIFDAFGNLLSPGDRGYTQAALSNRLPDVNLTGTNSKVESFSATVEMGQLLASFIVVNGTAEQLLDNDAGNDPEIYFSHLGANKDGVDHVRLLGDNTFGFEDLPGGGDLDYNDMIVKTTIR